MEHSVIVAKRQKGATKVCLVFKDKTFHWKIKFIFTKLLANTQKVCSHWKDWTFLSYKTDFLLYIKSLLRNFKNVILPSIYLSIYLFFLIFSVALIRWPEDPLSAFMDVLLHLPHRSLTSCSCWENFEMKISSSKSECSSARKGQIGQVDPGHHL